MNDQQIEQEIQAKGLTAPRVTPADIEANIASEHYFTAAEAIAPPVEAMVNRFLSWKLPKDFHPDGGMVFIPTKDRGYDSPHWPCGTNLMTAEQARKMFERVTGWRDAPEALKLLTFCVLVLRNGFTVTGESACASPENFDAELGRIIARQNAVQKMWPLMGYALKDRLVRGD